MRRSALLCLFLIVGLTGRGQSPTPKTHRLEVTASTVAYGYYWSEAKPALRVASGDIVDGEVDQTAIETSLRGRLQLTVRKGMKLTWPRAETATDFISMAADPDLSVATKTAIQEIVDFLSDSKKLTKQQAYQLVSISWNVAVTQLVDKPNVGVHVKAPKNIFK